MIVSVLKDLSGFDLFDQSFRCLFRNDELRFVRLTTEVKQATRMSLGATECFWRRSSRLVAAFGNQSHREKRRWPRPCEGWQNKLYTKESIQWR
jgi:hypothetical protein